MTIGKYEFKLASAAVEAVIEDANKIQKGEWAWIDRTLEWGPSGDEPAGSKRVLMIYARCPDCGFLSTLWRISSPPGHSHNVDANGVVTPSVECPHKPCGFHTGPTTLLGFKELRFRKV